MAYVWQRWLVKELRAAGLKVVEVEGWENRGRPASTGNFDPRGPVTNHHTGTTTSATRRMPTLQTLIQGRPDLPGPLAQVGVAYDGTVYVIAAGRSNHAGRVGKRGVAGMPYGADGNALAIGDEVDTNGTQTMPGSQRNSIAVVNAVVLKHFERGTDYAHRHQDISGTGKWDIGNLTTAQVRSDAGAKLKVLNTAPVTTHTRWAIRETGVHETPAGKLIRNIPEGYRFSVVDGSGYGNDGWIQTGAGNWVLGKDTTTRDPALPSRLSVFTHNIKSGRDWSDDVLPKTNALLAATTPGVACLQECYDAPDLRGLVPSYGYVYQSVGLGPETPGYIEEHSANVILVRDGVEVKARAAYEMTQSWKGPKLGLMHDPRIHRRVTVNEDDETWRIVNVHGPFGDAARREFLAWAREEFEALVALGDPVIFIGDWNVDFETLKNAMGPLATVDGGAPDMVATANCREVDSKNLGPNDSDHPAKKWLFEAA